MITEAEINALLKEYITDVGKDAVPVSSPVSREYAISLANELYEALYEKSREVTKSGASLFGYEWSGDGFSDFGGLTKVSVRTQPNGDVKVTIRIDPESIARERLSYQKDGQWVQDSEPSVYDIVGLFTQGYTAENYAYGSWESAVARTGPQFVRSHSLGTQPGLAPNPFVDEVIDAFHAKYFGIIKDIRYPTLWHS